MLLEGVSVVRSTCCSWKRPAFGSQHLKNGSHAPVSPAGWTEWPPLAVKGMFWGLGSNSGLQAGKQMPLPVESSCGILALCVLILLLYIFSSTNKPVRTEWPCKRSMIYRFVLTHTEGCQATKDPAITEHVC